MLFLILQRHSTGLTFTKHSKSRQATPTHEEWSLPNNIPWQCAMCTFENGAGVQNCEMCCSSRRATATVSAALRDTEYGCIHSTPMENVRLTEEEAALRKWEHIVVYCKQVQYTYFKFFTFILQFLFNNLYLI